VKVLRNAFYTIDTDFADGQPVQEVHIACYVYKARAKVDIRTYYDLVSGEIRSNCHFYVKEKEILRSCCLDTFCGTLEAMGYQIGYHDNEGVTLTELGKQEASLLSCIPYLFTETPEMGEQ